MLLHLKAIYLYNSRSMAATERGTSSRKYEFFFHNAPPRRHIHSHVDNALGVLFQILSNFHLAVIQVSNEVQRWITKSIKHKVKENLVSCERQARTYSWTSPELGPISSNDLALADAMVKLKVLLLEKILCVETGIKRTTENSRMKGMAFHTYCNLIKCVPSPYKAATG